MMVRSRNTKLLYRAALLSGVAGLGANVPALAQDSETRIETDAEAVADADSQAIIVTPEPDKPTGPLPIPLRPWMWSARKN